MANDFNMSLTDELKRAINIAQSLTKEFSNEKISPAHLLKALFHIMPYLVHYIFLFEFYEALCEDST